MLFSKSSQCAALLGSAALFSAVAVSAQTLEHRPPAKPAPPSVESSPAGRPLPGPPVLPAGTSLQVESLGPYPMKSGETIEGRLVYPLYVHGKLVVPEDTRSEAP